MSAVDQEVRPIIVGVGGLTSNVGKTTLMCELLRAFPGWEAIKTTRGHYRSCGKDPGACCVSDLLGDEAVIRSGRAETYAAGKDTGCYWECGASNVHWMIATDDQVAEGIRKTIARVNAPGVFIEGNSFSEHVSPDYFIMVARSDQEKIKSTAKRALPRVSAFYLSEVEGWVALGGGVIEKFDLKRNLPVFSRGRLTELIFQLQQLKKSPTKIGVGAS
jgi:hypothetical protein